MGSLWGKEYVQDDPAIVIVPMFEWVGCFDVINKTIYTTVLESVQSHVITPADACLWQTYDNEKITHIMQKCIKCKNSACMCIGLLVVKWYQQMIIYTSSFISINLTHWGHVTHICVGKLTITGSDNGLSPGRRQAIIWTNAGISLIGPLGTNFSEILIGIQTFSFKKMHLKMSSAKWCPFCLGLNELMYKDAHGMSDHCLQYIYLFIR